MAKLTLMKLDVLARARVLACLLPLAACAPAVTAAHEPAQDALSVDGARTEYVVGGRVAGLEGIGLSLHISTGEEVKVDDDGRFSFGRRLEDGRDYEVTIAREPISPVQSCVIERGAGTIEGKNATQIFVVCATSTFDEPPAAALASR